MKVCNYLTGTVNCLLLLCAYIKIWGLIGEVLLENCTHTWWPRPCCPNCLLLSTSGIVKLDSEKRNWKDCVEDYVRELLIVVDIRVRLSLRHPNLVLAMAFNLWDDCDLHSRKLRDIISNQIHFVIQSLPTYQVEPIY